MARPPPNRNLAICDPSSGAVTAKPEELHTSQASSATKTASIRYPLVAQAGRSRLTVMTLCGSVIEIPLCDNYDIIFISHGAGVKRNRSVPSDRLHPRHGMAPGERGDLVVHRPQLADESLVRRIP